MIAEDDVDYEEKMGYERSSEDEDDEAELQEAFAQGRLKPGLNIEKKEFANNDVKMNQILNRITLKLPWIERLDLNSKPAPLAPQLASKLQEEKENIMKRGGKPDDPALNDFERESMFHRQAQGAAMEGVKRLKELGILTKRPDDYYAEMTKNDAHMQRVRASLLRKQVLIQHAEKVRNTRQMRKISKEVQKNARVQKENEKREFLDKVKKYRQKMSSDLDFLDAKPKPKPKVINKAKKPVNRKVEAKRKFKNEKYGMGGRKKGSKQNTKESAADVSGRKRHGNARGMPGKKNKPPRPGKSKRMKQKSRKKH